jgi:hypothetical protein
MRVRLFWKCWDFLITGDGIGPGRIGSCDCPEKTGKAMRVRPGLRGQEMVEGVLHEGLHAGDYWRSDEEWVRVMAKDLARLLCRQEILLRIIDHPTMLRRLEPLLRKRGWVKRGED